jgi:hypothetical protein
MRERSVITAAELLIQRQARRVPSRKVGHGIRDWASLLDHAAWFEGFEDTPRGGESFFAAAAILAAPPGSRLGAIKKSITS